MEEIQFYVGKIKWYGTYNSQIDDFCQYGFIEQLDSAEDIFFHKNAVRKDSQLLKKYNSVSEMYVAYEVELSGRTGKKAATNLRMLSELEPQCIKELVERSDTDEQLQHALAVSCPEVFASRDISILIKYIDQKTVAEYFSAKYEKSSYEEILHIFTVYLDNPEVKKVLQKIAPALYFGNDMSKYIDSIIRGKHSISVKEYFWSQYSKGIFLESICEGVTSWLKKQYIYGSWQSALEAFLEIVDWEKEKEVEILNLLLCLKQKKFSVLFLLSKYPNLIRNEKLFSQLTLEDIPEEMHEDLVSAEGVEYCFRNGNVNLQNQIVENTSEGNIIHNEFILAHLDDNQACSIAKKIDWENTSDTYIRRYEKFLSKCEANKWKKTSVQIVKDMRSKGMSLNFSWWEYFTDSLKVRMLIYLSSYAGEREKWFVPLKKIHEKEKNNKLLYSVLYYFVLLYPDKEEQMKQKFLKAHQLLMEYIAECFAELHAVPAALDVLMAKCSVTSCYCDARPWAAKGAVFCPEGEGKPMGGRKMCAYIEKLETRKPEAVLEKQDMVDLLLNVNCNLDISDLKISNMYEYPYKMAGYVNQLLLLDSHMGCSKCNARFYPKFEYPLRIPAKLSLDVYSCPNAGDEKDHDQFVYLNFCYKCHRVIDSRECLNRENTKDGQYRCMYCGGTAHIEPGTQCPACLNHNSKTIDYNVNQKIIECRKCGYRGGNFKSFLNKDVEGGNRLNAIPVVSIPEAFFNVELPFD